jgi:hypothetical protein
MGSECCGHVFTISHGVSTLVLAWQDLRRAMIHLVSLYELPAKLNQLEIAAGG